MSARLPRALFVCVENAGRSQIAQAFWERAGGEARSAGSHPASAVHPNVIEVMREVGIDLTNHVPRGLTPEDAEWADVGVTMGCGDACPYMLGKRYIDWEQPDPKDRDLARVRALRDVIADRISQLATATGGQALVRQRPTRQ
jgi:arsenate reductase (thioredoxin)